MIAFKFLRPGSQGRFSGTAWPRPSNGTAGTWLETTGPLGVCTNGIHACSQGQLAYWLDEELWRVELDGELQVEPTLLLARRGRLLGPIGAWPEAAAAFAARCAEQAAALVTQRPGDARLAELADDAAWYAERAADTSQAVLAAYTTAVAADLLQPGGFDKERDRQSHSLAHQLGLT